MSGEQSERHVDDARERPSTFNVRTKSKSSQESLQEDYEQEDLRSQQTKRFSGFNVEHQFNENFVIGGTLLNLNERPITQKANYGTEPINNTIFGLNGNYSTEVPFLTRMANKLPNIDSDVNSNVSVRGEFAYLKPGAPKGTDFNSEVTSYIDDFEGTQNGISLLSPQAWFLSSRTNRFSAAGSGNVRDHFKGPYPHRPILPFVWLF